MKTNNFAHPVFSYLETKVQETDFSGYDLEKLPESTPEKITQILSIFRKEKSYEIKKIGEYKAFTEWLQGLPFFHIDFWNHEILKLAYDWGSIETGLSEKKKEKREDLILNNWFNFITIKFFQLARHYKVN